MIIERWRRSYAITLLLRSDGVEPELSRVVTRRVRVETKQNGRDTTGRLTFFIIPALRLEKVM